ncbi:MAG: arsenate reductase ArsC [Candidatus Omnitrophica bacterium]|nr:arsenate reductase ArsC [Candidatus Omnitrophota bacterium]
MKSKVLFVCIHNSARSQMAEELLRSLAGDQFDVESAGIEPGQLNPAVIEVLKEEGINITGKKTCAVSEKLKKKIIYDYVITVCDETSAERCPVIPGTRERLHWSFKDPSSFKGTDAEKMDFTRRIKEQIKHKIKSWLNS